MNKLKAAWAEGRGTLNGWLAIPSAFAAEVMAEAGFDSLTVDMQHGVQDYASAVACFQGMGNAGAVPMARVPWLEPGIVGKMLDAGAQGLICPMTNTAAEVAAFVAACRYPPEGLRSFGPIRAGRTGSYGEGRSYFDAANREVLCIPMIETRQALEGLDAILDVPGVDGFYVGPADLGISLGLKPAMDREEPEMLRAYERIVKAVRGKGLGLGIHCLTGAYARRALDMGFTFATVNSDSGLMLEAARANLRAARGG